MKTKISEHLERFNKYDSLENSNRFISACMRIVDMCLHNQGYHVAIIAHSKFWRKSFMEYLIEYMMENDIFDFQYYIHESILFPNGSVIQSLPVNDGVRGRRFHYAFVEIDVNTEYIDTCIKPLLIEYNRT